MGTAPAKGPFDGPFVVSATPSGLCCSEVAFKNRGSNHFHIFIYMPSAERGKIEKAGGSVA